MNRRLNLTNTTSFDEELNGISCMRIRAHGGQALIAAQGAQVLSWTDSRGQERLYLSPLTLSLSSTDGKNAFGSAIRGGVPVCFPQFSDRGSIMKHGFARNRIWSIDDILNPSLVKSNNSGCAVFHFKDDELSRTEWPHQFHAEMHTELMLDQLRMQLQIKNTGSTCFSFTLALHTYLRVQDIRQTCLHGLQGMSFEDATNGNVRLIQDEQELQILHEVDRVYLGPPEKLILCESNNPTLLIEQHGFTDTVVWNPGPDKAKALKDFPDDDWLHMLCVEAACVDKPVSLKPNETWIGSQILTVPLTGSY